MYIYYKKNNKNQIIHLFISYPGRWFRPPDHARSCRKDAGKSPYPAEKHRKSLEHRSSIPAESCPVFFPTDSCQLPVLSGRNRSESFGKNPKIFLPEYYFNKITGITRNRPFPSRTVRPGYMKYINIIISEI